MAAGLLQHARAWFSLTPQEKLLLGGILLIALIGVAARHWHLAHQAPEAYQPVAAAAGESPSDE